MFILQKNFNEKWKKTNLIPTKLNHYSSGHLIIQKLTNTIVGSKSVHSIVEHINTTIENNKLDYKILFSDPIKKYLV